MNAKICDRCEEIFGDEEKNAGYLFLRTPNREKPLIPELQKPHDDFRMGAAGELCPTCTKGLRLWWEIPSMTIEETNNEL